MSTVSSGSSADSNSRLRDHVENKEQESIKKQKKEISKLNQVHVEKLDKVQKQHQEQMKDVSGETQEALNRRDVKYQKQIEGLKKIYEDQLRAKQSEQYQQTHSLQDQNKQELESSKQRYQQREGLLVQKNENALRQQEASHSDVLNSQQSKSKSDHNNNRETLANNYDEKLNVIQTDRREQMGESRLAFEKMKIEKNQRIKDLELEKFNQREKLYSEKEFALKTKERDFSARFDDQRHEYKASLEDQNAKLRSAVERRAESENKVRGTANQDLEERVVRTTSGLQRSLEEEQNRTVRVRTELKRQHGREQANLRSSFQDNIDQLQSEKAGIVEISNEDRKKSVDSLNKSNGKILTNQNQFYLNKISQLKMNSENEQVKTNLMKNIGRHAQEVKSDVRSELQRAQYESDKKRLSDYYDESREVLADNHSKSVRELREQQQRAATSQMGNYEERVKELDAKHQAEIGHLKLNFQDKTNALSDAHRQDLASSEKVSNNRLAERESYFRNSIETKDLQYKKKVGDIERSHRDEITKINERHQLELERVTRVQNKKA